MTITPSTPNSGTPSPATADVDVKKALAARKAIASMTVDRVVERFDDLPTLAPVAVEVLRLADDPDSSMTDITRTIEQDPGLTLRLLRLANNASYSRGGEVSNINRAAMLLGTRTLKLITLGFSLVANLTSNNIDTTILWRRSLAAAVIARRLAVDRKIVPYNSRTPQAPPMDPELLNPELMADDFPDDSFVAALLANVGRLAMVEEPVYVETAARFGAWIKPDKERVLFGFTSDEVTVGILSSWGLPAVLTDAIAERNKKPGDKTQTPIGAILGVADAAAEFLIAEPDGPNAQAFDELVLVAAANLGMTIGDVELVLEELRPELGELAKMFDFEPIGAEAATELVRSAHVQLVRLSSDLVDDLAKSEGRNKRLLEQNSLLEDAASIDTITGLPNRRIFDLYIENRIAGRRRHPRTTLFGLVLLDIDRFKRINDRYGHGIGDEVLAELGERLLNGTRRGELAARIGGEEFALILPETAEEELPGATERLRALVGNTAFETSAGPLHITASLGACCTSDMSDGSEVALKAAADRALYAAKEAGRNRAAITPALGG